VDEAFAFFAPMIIGGREAKGIAEGKGVSSLSKAAKMRVMEVGRLGRDVLIHLRRA